MSHPSYSPSSHRPSQQSSTSKWQDAADSIEKDYNSPTYSSWQTINDEPEDYDSEEWLQKKTKKVQQESLESSQRALGRVHEASSIAQSNLSALAGQTEQLKSIEKRLELAEQHAKISEAKSDRLKSLNRFFMIPAFGSKAAKRKEEALTRRLEERKEAEMTKALREQDERERLSNRHHHAIQGPSRSSSSLSHSKIYSTPNGLERDETEEEIDSNLHQISSGLNRLKMMSQSMNSELIRHDHQLENIQDKTDVNRSKVRDLNRKMESISRRR